MGCTDDNGGVGGVEGGVEIGSGLLVFLVLNFVFIFIDIDIDNNKQAKASS